MTASWLILIVVGAVPIIAMMQDGAGIFGAHQYARVIWAGLIILAIAAVFVQLGFLIHWPSTSGSPLLLALPLMQGIAFLGSQRLFRHVYGRGTVCFSVAKNSKDVNDRVRWSDIIYWLIVGYVGTALSFLVAFKTGLHIST